MQSFIENSSARYSSHILLIPYLLFPMIFIGLASDLVVRRTDS